MSKCNYQTYRYTRELCFLENQSVVECRFPGAEMVAVLAVQARVVESECVCADGEVKYSGKLILGVVYEDVNKRICRAERGAEFFHKAVGNEITPACFAKGAFSARSVTHRREGASTYVSVVIGAEIAIYTQAEIAYLEGGEDVVVKKEGQRIAQVSAVTGEIEETDDFDVDGVVDVLLHEEKAHLTSCRVGLGEIGIEGEICYDVCALKEDGSVSRYERILPVKMSLPCEEGREEDGAKVTLEVRRAEVSLTVNEEDNRAKIAFACGVYADCTLYKTVEVEMGVDAFCPTQKLALKTKKVAGRYLTEQKSEVLRVAGTAVASFAEEGWTLSCVFLPSVEVSKQDDGIEGILEVQALLKSEEGGYKVSVLSLPFAESCKIAKGDEISYAVSGLTVRNFGKDTTQVEGIIKCAITSFGEVEAEYVSQVEEVSPIPKKDSAITIFLPKKGEGLWEVAKKMGVPPEEVERCNPEVVFPIREGEKIVVYRQKV